MAPRSNNADTFKIQRMMLQMIGIWPIKNPSILNKLHGFASLFIIFAFATSLFLSVVFIKDYSPLIQSWAMLVSILNCCMKLAVFYFKVPALVELLEFLHSFHFHYYDEDLDVHVQSAIRTATIMAKIFLGSSVCTVSSLVVSPFISPKPRQLPLPFPFDLNNQSFILYSFAYIHQAMALFVGTCTSTGFDNVATGMMKLSSEYFKILKITITRSTDVNKALINKTCNSDDDNDLKLYRKLDKEVNKRLSTCVKHHLAVIKFTESVESIFTYIFLVQFLASVVGICLAGFTFTHAAVGSTEFAFAMSLPLTLVFQISLYCYFGNEVTLQSSTILDACYMTDWIACGPTVRRTLFIIMERSKRPLKLTAGKFITLSLSSLVTVLKSAVSYGTVLQQLTDKD